MDRLTLIRRPKAGDKVECLPAGDGLPVWTTIPLDKKLPMMQNPKGSVILCTTKLGQPRHRCKQEYDFDLRDPNGKYISNVYHPLHDPHLKSYFSREVMRRHLNKKGFISDDGKVLCSLREFNQYRQYLRHIFFLESAKERKEELERRAVVDDKAEFRRKVSRGSLIRRRLQQLNERNMNDLKNKLDLKTEKLEIRLTAIREEMIAREGKQRAEAERRQMAVYRTQQEMEQRNQMLIKRWRQKDRLRERLIEDREAQRKIQAEMKCLEKWNERKMSQKDRLERQAQILQQEDEYRIQNIAQRERFVNRQRYTLEKKIDTLKEITRERKRTKDELYAKRFEEKLASGDYRKWTRTREKRNKHRRTFNSTWDLKDVLKNLQVTETILEKPEVPEDPVLDEDEVLRSKAREIVDGVLEKVKNEIYPAYLKSIGEDDGQSNEATPSKSVRFSHDDDDHEVSGVMFDVNIVNIDDGTPFRPVTEHILTPCASQLEVQKLEADAILGSAEIGEEFTSASFVETLLLRLLDDLNSGRLRQEDIMKLASYSMDIIRSLDSERIKESVIIEEFDSEGATVASSSSSIIARKLVDFTLGRILNDIQSGNVHRDNLASLTVSLVDISGGGDESSVSLSVSDTDLDDYIDETIKAATSSAMDPREDSPVCEALLDNFMVNTLKKLMRDLEDESLSADQIQALAKAVKEETKILTATPGQDFKDLRDIQFVLETFLAQLKSGDIDSQSLYQIVFTIVYSYSIIRSPPTITYESKITELLKDVLTKAEEKALSDGIDLVNPNIVHEACDRLSHTNLDIGQIEQLSSSIMTVSTKSDVVCKTTSSEIARSIVEDALLKAKEQIENEELGQELMEGVQNVAEAVIVTLVPEARSPPLVDVFVEILEHLKESVESRHQMNKDEFDELCDLINKVKSHSIGPDDVADMATAVAEIAKNPPKSDASVTAFYAVKNTLKAIRDDFHKGQVEQDIIKEMIDILRFSCKTVISSDPKSPELLVSLAAFIRTILNLLSSKLRTGELDQSDLDELSFVLKERLETKSSKSGNRDDIGTDVDNGIGMLLSTDNVMDYLAYLVDNIETGVMHPDEIQTLGTKLIESGRALMASLSEKVSSINTDDAADGAVEEVLRTLQMEIDSGILTKDSLKEITKSIITSSSNSDLADELIDGAIKSIERDVRRGYAVKDIPSVPTLDHSPSASTIASYVVMQTIDELRKSISERGIPSEMVLSVASSLVIYLSTGKTDIGDLPAEFEQYRNTISNMVACLRDDRISSPEAEKLFCLILERYREFMSANVEPKEHTGLSLEDTDLVKDLVSETLRNIERSVASGKLFDKAFSIPSAASSHDTSNIADTLVETCLQNIKDHIQEEEVAKTQKPQAIVDFILQIIEILQAELTNGTISKLSMATFFHSISTDTGDLKGLEENALENLSFILSDIKENRSNSIYINRILDTYLTTDQTMFGALCDPVNAVKSILVSVSSDILTKFVKATIENIIMDMRDGSSCLQRESSTYVLGATSSVVAESVVKKVLEKVKEDLGGSVKGTEGTNKDKSRIARAASRLLTSSETPNGDIIASASQQSSSISSKGVEDVVLETLHNIVSNLRLEQSLLLQDGQKNDIDNDSEASQEIHDFVLQTLQNIVTDLQDKRSQIDIGALKTEGTTYEIGSKESLQAAMYVNEILHTVLRDMKLEMSSRSGDSPAGEQNDTSPLKRENTIIDTMIKAFSGTSLQKRDSALEPRQKEGVKHILIESIKTTIVNVSEGKFDQDELQCVYESISKSLDDALVQDAERENVSNLQNKVLSLLMSLYLKMENLSVNDEMLDKLSSHLATVGMETATVNERSAFEVVSNSSVTSSEVSDLVKGIIAKISQQLIDEGELANRKEQQETNAITDDDGHKTSVDRNFNRRDSASSSCTSALNKDSSDTSSTSINAVLPKRKVLSGAKSKSLDASHSTSSDESLAMKVEKKGKRRSLGSQTQGQNQTPDRHEDRLLSRKPMQKPRIHKTQNTKSDVKGCTNTKVKTDTPIPVHYRMPRTTDKTLYPRSNKAQGFNSASSSTTPVRTVDFKQRLTTRPKLRSPDLTRLSPDNGGRKTPVTPPETLPESPFELKSLCGVHKTRIRYRTNVDDSTTDDGSYTSELF